MLFPTYVLNCIQGGWYMMATAYNNDIEKLIPKSTREKEGLELITCKRQPGNLRITKYACALRYKKSLRMEEEIPDDEFGMIVKHGLERCRDCPRGRRYAQVLLDETATERRSSRKRRMRMTMHQPVTKTAMEISKRTRGGKQETASIQDS